MSSSFIKGSIIEIVFLRFMLSLMKWFTKAFSDCIACCKLFIFCLPFSMYSYHTYVIISLVQSSCILCTSRIKGYVASTPTLHILIYIVIDPIHTFYFSHIEFFFLGVFGLVVFVFTGQNLVFFWRCFAVWLALVCS